jgi:chromate transporter
MNGPRRPSPAIPESLAAGAGAGAGGSAVETFLAFLRLGLTSFGGPIAHIGYFRHEFVQRRGWLDDRAFSDLVALCQLLPGPASSQLGMAIGFGRAGWAGSLAAWLGFTLPSALALILFALGVANFSGVAASGAVLGLKVVAVAVVAQAVWGMARSLCPDRLRSGLAIGAALLLLVLPGFGVAPAVVQVGVILLAGLLGRWLLKLPAFDAPAAQQFGISPRAGRLALLLFTVLLVGLPLLAAATGSRLIQLVDGFYRAGALVFGGGHVVLPLLQSVVVPSGAVSNADFLAGYGAAQAVPGPLFTFAAYLGSVMPMAASPDSSVAAATTGAAWWAAWPAWGSGLLFLAVIFLPAYLLIAGVLPFWEGLRRRVGIRSAIAGINAAVVGILLAALYDPVFTSAIGSRAEFALALGAFGLLVIGRVPPAFVVLMAALAGWALAG